MIDDEFIVVLINTKKTLLYLMPENKNYQPIKVKDENELIIWGYCYLYNKKSIFFYQKTVYKAAVTATITSIPTVKLGDILNIVLSTSRPFV